jgi:hypothetical protein
VDKFIVVGSGGSIETSSDGITWTLQSTNINSELQAIVWNGSFYIAVGTLSGTGKAWKSSNLTSWSVVNIYPYSSDVIWANNQFMISFGNPNASTGQGFIATSPDGVTWTIMSFNPNPVPLFALTASDNKFVAVGFGNPYPPYTKFGKIYTVDFDVPAISFTVPATTISGINAVTSVAVPLNYYRNSAYTGNTISLGYSLAKTRTDAGHPYQNQARTVVANLAITLNKV